MNVITELLASIKERKTINELLRYIDAPVNNKTEDITRLVKYYSRYYPDFDNEDRLQPEIVAKALFRDISKLEDKLSRLRTISKRTTPLIKDFLIAKQLEKDEFTRRRLLLKAYAELNLPDLYESELRETRKKLENHELYGEYEYWTRYYFNKEYYFDSKRSYDEKISIYDDLSSNLDYHYFLGRLKIIIELNFASINNKTLEKQYLPISIIENIKSELSIFLDPEDAPIDIIILQLYFNIYNILTTYNVKNEYVYDLYIESKSLLEEHDRFISLGEKEPIFHYLLNALAIVLNKQGATLTDEIFELYRLGLKSGVLIVHGELHENHYANILHLALSLEKLDWLENSFINKYLALLNNNSKKDTIILTKSFVNFQRNKFELVYSLLSQSKFSSRFFDLRARVLKLKAAYKLNNTDLFESAYNSFRLYLLRNSKQFGEAIVNRNKNFIDIVLLLDKKRSEIIAFYSYDKTKTKKNLMDELNARQSMVDKLWLLKQIEEL